MSIHREWVTPIAAGAFLLLLERQRCLLARPGYTSLSQSEIP